jgi:hypothetical protein
MLGPQWHHFYFSQIIAAGEFLFGQYKVIAKSIKNNNSALHSIASI